MPKFFDLCSDSLWGIRKACAECFMMVSNSTSPEVRRAKLSPLFISLISDQSRWVRCPNPEDTSHPETFEFYFRFIPLLAFKFLGNWVCGVS